MPLNSELVDQIHKAMLVRYGALWINLWAGVPQALVKSDWARHLHGLGEEAIAYGMENLPDDKPVTAAQFKTICIRCPQVARASLPPPKPDPSRVAAELSRMRAATAERDRLQWAYDLQERENRGDRLTPGQRAAWRDALASVTADAQAQDQFNPIPADALPPAMRPARMGA